MSEQITAEQFKTMILVKLEMLRGCCQTASIKKSQIAESIIEFSNKVKKVEIKK
jgi:hypothetical protein